MKMTMTMAMKMDSRAMEMIFPTGSGRDSLDLHDLRVGRDSINFVTFLGTFHYLILEQKPVVLKVSGREEEEMFEEILGGNRQVPQGHSCTKK